MSRYIRIKNEIIDLNRTHLNGSPIYNLDTKENVIKANENGEERDCYYIENDTIYTYWYSDGCIWEDHIIKQSDNLVELCDGFYIDVLGDGAFNFDGLYVYNDFDDFKEHYISYHNYDDVENGYGFIKTNKGLIYVAKMNENGKLVLIRN